MVLLFPNYLPYLTVKPAEQQQLHCFVLGGFDWTVNCFYPDPEASPGQLALAIEWILSKIPKTTWKVVLHRSLHSFHCCISGPKPMWPYKMKGPPPDHNWHKDDINQEDIMLFQILLKNDYFFYHSNLIYLPSLLTSALSHPWLVWAVNEYNLQTLQAKLVFNG